MQPILSFVHRSLVSGLFGAALLNSPLLLAQTCNEGNMLPSTPSSDFITSDAGVVTHIKTGLMWKRCSEGQTWDGKSCSGIAANYNWQESLQRLQGYSFAGYNDWRLPNKNELASIVETNCERPTINAEIFPNTPSAYFWSSTPFAAFTNMAWSVHFNNAFVYYEYKHGAVHVRLVRG